MDTHVNNQARAAGIENILALRGDPPKGATAWEKCEVRALILPFVLCLFFRFSSCFFVRDVLS
jgi:hypothetical protein